MEAIVKPETTTFVTPEQVRSILPHEDPALYILNGVEVQHESRSGHTTFVVTEEMCRGHFPGNPMLPGYLIIEAGAQLLGVVASSFYDVVCLWSLITLTPEFRGSSKPGDVLTFTAQLERAVMSCGAPKRLIGSVSVTNGGGKLITTIGNLTLHKVPLRIARLTQ
jgi:3-hydroxymyristoyl/3-hydroxydecanoyl-(acyl carrier protein) dehydratase